MAYFGSVFLVFFQFYSFIFKSCFFLNVLVYFKEKGKEGMNLEGDEVGRIWEGMGEGKL